MQIQRLRLVMMQKQSSLIKKFSAVGDTQFTFPKKAKIWTYVLMAIGLVGLIWAFATAGGHEAAEGAEHAAHGHDGTRVWSNILINSFFFTAIALGAIFFYAVQYAAEVAWSAQLKRIFEAMFQFLYPGLGLIVVVLIVGHVFHGHHIWHWMDSDLYYQFTSADGLTNDVAASTGANPKFDHVIAAKSGYFAGWFYWLRTIVYIAVFFIFASLFRKWSKKEDEIGGINLHKKVFKRSALFLVFFAVFSSTLAWDWLMSIDTHWFSTMYGWYVFSGMWVTCMIFATILTLYLKKQGYLPKVNQSHIHDLGKWMFAISMLWSYLWFCQFMLIWYSNIPEEVQYFVTRIWTDTGDVSSFRFPFFLMFFVNFAVPFYVLVARDAKRNAGLLVGAGMLIFITHFIDVYLLVIPGVVGEHGFANGGGFMWWEWAMFIGFTGFFVHVVLRSLTKARLVPANHPLMEESENHWI
jgi:hypothetical protein